MTEPTQNRLDRHKILFQYMTALEHNDFGTVADILEKAAGDVALESMILDVNAALVDETQSNHAPLPADINEQSDIDTNTLASTLDEQFMVTPQHVARRFRFPSPTLTIAAMLALIFSVMLVLNTVVSRNIITGVFRTKADRQFEAFERFIAEAWNSGDTTVLNAVLTDDSLYHDGILNAGDVTGVEDVGLLITNLRAAMPDLSLQIEEATIEDDVLTAQVLLTGTQSAPLALLDGRVLPATGKSVRLPLTLTGQFDNRKLAEMTTVATDGADLIRTLGFITPETAGDIRELSIFGGYGAITDMAWSPDGNSLVLSSFNGTVWQFDANNLEDSPRLLGSYLQTAMSLSFSPDGLVVASVGFIAAPNSLQRTVRSIRLWDIETGELVHELDGQNISQLVYSSDGRAMVGNNDFGTTARVFDVTTGEELALLVGHDDFIKTIASSSVQDVIATGSMDTTIRVWSATNGVEVTTLHEHDSPVESVAFSPNSTLIASGDADGVVRLWDWNRITGQRSFQLGTHEGGVTEVLFSPDGRYLASAGKDDIVRLWRVDTGLLETEFVGHSDDVIHIAFNPDGTRLASIGKDEVLRLWDVQSQTQYSAIPIVVGHGAVHSIDISPDGLLLASVGADMDVRLWDSTNGQLRTILAGNSGALWGVRFSPDGRFLVAVGIDSSARLWDVVTGEVVTIFPTGTGPRLPFEPSFSPDGRLVALPVRSGDVPRRVWEVATGDAVMDLTGHDGVWHEAAFSPDGTLIATSGSDGTIRLRDTATGVEQQQFDTDAASTLAVIFHPSGEILAASDSVGVIHLWNVTTGETIMQLQAHGDWVQTFAFSPDGTVLVTGGGTQNTHNLISADSTIKFWDVATGALLRTIDGHLLPINKVVFSPDGTRVYSASTDGTIRVWGLTANDTSNTEETNED